jgi:hypothetical protein
VDAVVENGVWTRQEAVFDSPINMEATVLRAPHFANMVTVNIALNTQ